MAANYPNNDPSDASLLIAANNVSSTLNGGLTAGAADATLASTTNFPTAGGITIESEAILYTSNNTAGSVLSGLARGTDSTTAATHANGTAVYMNWQARHHNQMKDEIVAIGADLRNTFDADLDDSQAVSTTAATIKMRLDQISNRIAALGNSTDWKSGNPGKFMDATMGTLSAQTGTASATFVATGLAVTLSMPTTTARALVTANATYFAPNSGANTQAIATIFRGAANIGGATQGLILCHSGGAFEFPGIMTLLDSPGTNGSVTYAVYFRSNTTTIQATWGWTETSTSRIIVQTLSA